MIFHTKFAWGCVLFFELATLSIRGKKVVPRHLNVIETPNFARQVAFDFLVLIRSNYE
jgi:hypothetical protein